MTQSSLAPAPLAPALCLRRSHWALTCAHRQVQSLWACSLLRFHKATHRSGAQQGRVALSSPLCLCPHCQKVLEAVLHVVSLSREPRYVSIGLGWTQIQVLVTVINSLPILFPNITPCYCLTSSCLFLPLGQISVLGTYSQEMTRPMAKNMCMESITELFILVKKKKKILNLSAVEWLN